MRLLFSVVIPAFNRVDTIVRAVDSVLAQQCQDFEIIVVDDGSSDDLAGAVAAIVDPRIRFVRQANSGASAARNRGIDLAVGTYVAFLDSDDAFLPHHLASMADLLRDEDKCVAYAPVRALRGRDCIVKPPHGIAQGQNMASYLMCGRGFVQTSGLVVPTEVARSVRYRNDVAFGDDTDFAIRIDLAGYRFVMASRPGVDWFDGPDPRRLSNARLGTAQFVWLEDLRPLIPHKAYLGYRGWHVAKSVFRVNPLKALWMYAAAVIAGAYGPRFAMVVLAQIVVPSSLYRDGSDLVIGVLTHRTRAIRKVSF